MPTMASALEAVAVAERARDYGRLTLTFRDRLDLPPYQIDAENGVLRLVFEDAVETNIADSMRILADFVTIARQDPDGKALRFGLARAVRINTMEAGETLFIDFLPSTWQGFPPPLPPEIVESLAQRAQQAAREAAEAERRRLLGELEPAVSLRIGKAPTFTRYAFDWNVPFNIAVTQAGPQLTMAFDYDVPIDLAPAFIDQPEELEGLTFERDGASLSITMDVRPGSEIRWFQDELSFIVDLERRVPGAPEEADQADIARVLDALNPDRGDDSQSTRFSSVGERSEDVVVPQEPGTSLEATRTLTGDDLAPTGGQTSAPDVPAQESGPQPPVPGVAGAIINDDISQRPDVRSASAPLAGRPPEASGTQREELDPDMVRVEVRADDQSTRLVFPFTSPTPAAAFRRERFVSLVFQSAIPFDLRSLRLELSDLVRSIEPMRVNDLNIVHLELRRDALLSMLPSGDHWVVVLGPNVLEPARAVSLERGSFPDGRAFAEIVDQGFGSVRRIVHPHVRDELIVVPMMPPARGALARQALVEFELLPSAQGLVIRPHVDGLEVEASADRVLISEPEGLSLSETGLSLGSFGFSPDERPGYFDMRAYLGDGPSTFQDRLDAYDTAIAAAEGPVLTERLIDFARFLVSFDLGQEANGLLDIALDQAPALEHDAAYLTLRAAALTLAQRHEEALAILNSHTMENVIDGEVWSLLSNAALRNWSEVNAMFEDVATLFDDYPSALVTQARLDGVEAALEVQAIDLASERLAQIDPARARAAAARRLQVLQGRLDVAKGRLVEALEAFDHVRDTAPGPIGAQATLLAIETRILADELTAEEGLEQLENLAVAWRGDDTEVRARILLGDLYVEQGRYGSALTALKGVAIAQPDHPMANAVSDQMQSIFVDLFLNGQADELAAIDALSLFYDFRELTPIGRRGDELVRRLADRLVSIDLLDQAADLLEHQVEFRLTGTAKAQIAADLALIYLMDYRPAEAVATLQRSRVSQIPMAIERGRRIIEARALSELGRHELAMEMLRDLNGTDVDRVRADVLWNAERWQEAGSVLERALASRWSDRVPLDEEEMQRVLRAAIAFSFANDAYALDRLRARYVGKMTDGVYASAFDVVTSPIEGQGSAFRDVVRGIAGLNTLNRFLADYRSTFSAQAIAEALPGA